MGVPGLWDLIRPAATRTSLSTLARESFLANHNNLRSLTIGIDASIWIFHAQLPQYGENPFLRTIFYKITALLQHPVLPVFVFDGPNKPARKRNERVVGAFGTADSRSKKFKELLDVCGLEWWNAPGEAEAELAAMNRQGKIDAVLSDDVDALLFGATCLLRNNSPTLSGAQASSTQNNAQRGDLRHYEMYRSSAIKDLWTSKDGSSLKTEEDCRLAMVLTALLGGGDYAPEGLSGFGPTITHGLAQAGYAGFLKHYGSARFSAERDKVFSGIVDELRTNSTNHIGRKYPSRAKDLQNTDAATIFPDFALDAYLNPATSPRDDPKQGWPGFGAGESSSRRGKARNMGKGDMEGMARACEKYFEWGTKDIVSKKFGSENVGIFAGQIINDAREGVWASTLRMRSPSPARQAVPEGPSRITSFFVQSASTAGPSKVTSPSAGFSSAIRKPPTHILKIHSTRKDPLNAELTEYRISYDPTHLVARCHSAMAGTRVDPKELGLEERQRLGLVDRGVDDDESPPPMPSATQAATVAAGKNELRVWVPEYLLQEAWPALLASYEESLKARAEKSKSPKKKAKVQPKGVSVAETEKFRSFFKSTQAAPPAKVIGKVTAESSTEEEVETIEDPLFASPKKNARPRPPTSSLSSMSASSRSESPSLPLLTTSSNAYARTTKGRGTSPARSVSLPRSSAFNKPSSSVSASKGGASQTSSKDVIDLCSSSDESALPVMPAKTRPTRQAATRSRARVLSASPKANLPAPSTKPTTRTKASAPASKPKDKGTAVSLVQIPLGLPVVSGPSRLLPKTTTKLALPEDASKKGKKGKMSMMVVYEDEEQEVIDSTRGLWRASQSPGLARLRG